LLKASNTGLPALTKTLHELKPVLAALDPFLANLNPIIRYTNAYKANVGDFLSNPPAGLAGTLTPQSGDPSARHVLRQLSYLSPESLAIYPQRLPTNRGNGYLQPLAINAQSSAEHGISPSFDCDNSGEIPASAATPSEAPCWVAPNFPAEFGGKKAPQVFADP
jgi:phospholipid/cholesterol/gamma-HCH transport system substrate-binding protein